MWFKRKKKKKNSKLVIFFFLISERNFWIHSNNPSDNPGKTHKPDVMKCCNTFRECFEIVSDRKKWNWESQRKEQT